MGLIQADFGDVERRSTSNSADKAFQRIFGFSSSVIQESAWRALRVATGTDGVHSQLSAAGSKFYHEFVSEVRAFVDTFDNWSANRSDDNKTSPRAYRSDGLTLAFAPRVYGYRKHQQRVASQEGSGDCNATGASGESSGEATRAVFRRLDLHGSGASADVVGCVLPRD